MSSSLRTPHRPADDQAFGLKRWFLVASEDTGGSLSTWIEEVPAGAGPPLHVHHREPEVFTVLSGRLTFALGDERLSAGPEETVVIPRGTPHTFKNEGAEPARALITLSPGGGEQFFRDVSAEGLGPDQMERIVEIAESYGLEFVGPPL